MAGMSTGCIPRQNNIPTLISSPLACFVSRVLSYYEIVAKQPWHHFLSACLDSQPILEMKF